MGLQQTSKLTILGANLVTNKNVSLVALDNFTTYDINRGTLPQQSSNSQLRYPNHKIVAGVNGDFFDINGIEIETTYTNLTLDITPGIRDISVRAYGEHDLLRQSVSDPFVFEIYSLPVQSIMDILSNYGQNSYQYLND